MGWREIREAPHERCFEKQVYQEGRGTSRYSAGESMWAGDTLTVQKCWRMGGYRESRALISLWTDRQNWEVRGWKGSRVNMKDVCEQLHIGCPGKLHQVVLPKAGLVDIMSQTKTLDYHERIWEKCIDAGEPNSIGFWCFRGNSYSSSEASLNRCNPWCWKPEKPVQGRKWCSCSSTTKATASVIPTWGSESTFTLQPEDQEKIGNLYALTLIPSLPKGAFTKFQDHRLKFIVLLFAPGNISQKMVRKEMSVSVADVQDFQTKAKVWVPETIRACATAEGMKAGIQCPPTALQIFQVLRGGLI